MSNTKRTGQTALYERLSRDDKMQGESNYGTYGQSREFHDFRCA